MQNATNLTDLQTDKARAEALDALDQAFEYYGDKEHKLTPDTAYQEYPDAA